ncbi:MAG: M20/M25/M40 family metallo-hydrolase [Gemmatimonadaceae bacterium]
MPYRGAPLRTDEPWPAPVGACTALLAAILLVACADAPTAPSSPAAVSSAAARAAAAGISSAEFSRLLGIIADDSMRGRATPSREVELTAAFAGAQFSSAGLTPGGEAGTFVQRFTLPAFADHPTATAPNAVAILEGSDATLRAEHLLVTAHMDHVGIAGGDQHCTAVGADSICNGANDNGSGTVAVLQLARAFAALQPRPRRTIVFAIFSGEERGLWGSMAYARAPALALPQAAAVINVDMIGRNATDSLFIVGKTYSTLGDVTDRITRAHSETGMRLVNDPWDGLYFTRSDQYSFARLGVPSLFFFNGPHADVHTASDDLGKMDADAAVRAVRMIFYTILDVADADHRPTWDPAARARWVVPWGR